MPDKFTGTSHAKVQTALETRSVQCIYITAAFGLIPNLNGLQLDRPNNKKETAMRNLAKVLFIGIDAADKKLILQWPIA